MACPCLKGFHEVNACLTGTSDRSKEECTLRIGEFWHSMVNDPTCKLKEFNCNTIDKSASFLESSKIGRWMYWDEIKALNRECSIIN